MGCAASSPEGNRHSNNTYHNNRNTHDNYNSHDYYNNSRRDDTGHYDNTSRWDNNYGHDNTNNRDNYYDDHNKPTEEETKPPTPKPPTPKPPTPKPPTPDNNRDNYYDDHNKPTEEETKPPTPKPPTPKPPSPKPPQVDDNEEDETPFDDDGIIDSEGYARNNMGLMIKSMDFRKHYADDDREKRPEGSPDNLYEDREFPLDIAIVQDNNGVEWKRPKEFLSEPKLFSEGTTRFDIGQGSAGTCWFLSTVANIAENQKMLEQIIPSDAYRIEDPDRYDGVFHARFFRFGKWEDVYIDDFLPVIYEKVLWGAKSATDSNELWVALLEKAFARLHGSYDAIYGGQPGDAYLLLTGGIGERIELEDNQDKEVAIFRRISNALRSGCQVSCVVPDEHDNHYGLVGGHAYSLVGVNEVGRTKLLRVRNPWGHGEWTGPWSDGSKEWETIRDTSISAPNKDDGEFYVSLNDFMDYFSQTTICSLTPDFDCDGSSDSLNHVLSTYGEWKGPTAAGFHKLIQNPRFCFTVTEEGLLEDGTVPFIAQIIQHSEKRKTDNVSMRCDVFRVLGDRIKPEGRFIAVEIQGKKTNIYTPELQASYRHRLKPGRHMIIPSTVDEGVEKSFLLRLFTPASLENVKEISPDVNVVSCENETTIDVSGATRQLTFEKTLFGEFISGKNAGGQVSYRESYHKNPQYVITIPDRGGEIPLVVHIMQNNVEPQYPVGIRLFKLDEDTQPPVDIYYLYDKYNDSPSNMEGGQSKFMISWDVDVRYSLPPGKYIALVHMDQPDTEKAYAIVFKSTTHINIKGYQTG